MKNMTLKAGTDQIQIEAKELLALSGQAQGADGQKAFTVADIRREDAFAGGTWPGAVHVPVSKADEYDDPDVAPLLPLFGEDRSKPVYLLCQHGELSLECAHLLREAGCPAVSIRGGYGAYLACKLRGETQPDRADELAERRMRIERSIIKKFRKQLWSRFTKAVRDYQLIREGDRIAVCISGGKDSMLMAKLMQEIARHGKVHFEPVFLCMNPGYTQDTWAQIENNAKILGIDLTVFESDIFDAVAGIEHHPCYLCARMRRGYLYNNAKQLGCNKIALGHHYDDVIETILMGILYAGKTETMMPKLHSQHFEGMELIRPMYLIREEDVRSWCAYNDLHFIQCACRFTQTCSMVGGPTSSKRAFVKQLIAQLSQDDAFVEQNIFNSVRDINLRTVLGYHKDGVNYSFLDDYDSL